ncbi:MAG: hypothetical protein WAM28_05280 [Chlamydiales bacterium]
MSISGDNSQIQLTILNQRDDQPFLRTTTSRRRRCCSSRCCSNLTTTEKIFVFTGTVLGIITVTGATIAWASCGSGAPEYCYENSPGFRGGFYTMIAGVAGLGLQTLICEI